MVDIVKKTILVVLLSVFMFSLLATTVLAFKGNIDGDCDVSIVDVVKVAISFGSKCDNSTCSDGCSCWGNYSGCDHTKRWNPIADLGLPRDGVITIQDIVVVALDFGKKEPAGTICEADGEFCTADECDGSGNCEYQGDYDCSDLDDQCNDGVCDEEDDQCVQDPIPHEGQACDDGLFCTDPDTCTAGICGGSDRDCSANDITGIETCTNVPDSNPFTWDFRQAFTSVCDEDLDVCTNGDGTITHTCSMDPCEAECEINDDCPDTDCDYLDGCNGEQRYYDCDDVVNDCFTLEELEVL